MEFVLIGLIIVVLGVLTIALLNKQPSPVKWEPADAPLTLKSKSELLSHAESLGLDPKELQPLDRDEVLAVLEKQGDL
jgi:hypothetical protein